MSDQAPLNGYICFWRHHRIEVWAETSLDAQAQALTHFRWRTGKKIRNASDLTVILAEKAGVPVTHTITS